MSIFITQLVYIKPGKEQTFEAFENVALPLISKHGGKLLLRIRAEKEAVLVVDGEPPYEIHLVEFTSEDDFQNFLRDDERKKFLHLKEEAVKSAVLYKGTLYR